MFDALAAFIWFVTKWTVILSWRFFTGAHMTGLRYNNSTWTRPAYNAKKRGLIQPTKYGWWKSKSRFARMGWRHGIFWPTLVLFIGFMWDWSSMLIILGFFTPGIWLLTEKYHHGWHRIRCVFQDPFVGHESDGSVTQHWAWKTKYRRAFRRVHTPKGFRWHPGIATHAELSGAPKLADIPDDMKRAVRAELQDEIPAGEIVHLQLLLDHEQDFG
jgi:hypothetical protein